MLAVRRVRSTDCGAVVALVATSAVLVADDDIVIDVHVGAGAWLEIVETAGTVAYNAFGAPSRWSARITVADGGRLTWLGEPFVVSDGANVDRVTTVDLAPTGTALLRETVVMGRVGERGGAVDVRTTVRQSGAPLLVERLDLTDPAERSHPGLLGPHRVVDTVSALGWRPPPTPELVAGQRFDLHAAGALARSLDATTHTSPLAPVARRWAQSMADGG